MASGPDEKKKKKQQQRQPPQAPAASSPPMPQETAESQMNLQVLLRVDAAAMSIVLMMPQVVLYEFRSNAWIQLGIEGPLFVYRRKVLPEHCFLLLNTQSSQNVLEPIGPSLNLQSVNQFLLYQSSSNNVIYGLWVREQAELVQLGVLIQKLCDDAEQAPPRVPLQPALTTPATANPAGSVNVLQMLDDAVRKANHTSDPVQPATAAVSTKASATPVRGNTAAPAATAAQSTPAHGGGRRSAKSSKHEAKRNVTPQPAVGNGRHAASSAHASNGVSATATPSTDVRVPIVASPWPTELPVPSTTFSPAVTPTSTPAVQSSSTPLQCNFNRLMQEATPAPAVVPMVPVSTVRQAMPSATLSATHVQSACAVLAAPVTAALPTSAAALAAARHPAPLAGQPLTTAASVVPTSVPAATVGARHSPAPPLPIAGPNAAKSELMLPGDFETSPCVEHLGSNHLGGSPPLAAAAPLARAEHRRASIPSMPPISLADHRQRPPVSVTTGAVSGLTMEQMQQGMVHLIKNNRQFLRMIHEAYLESLNPQAL